MKPQKRAYIELKNRADASLTCKPCFFTHATTVPSQQFSGWPAYMSHFNQKACPVFHTPSTKGATSSDISPAHGTHTSGTDAAEEDNVPAFHRPDTISLAKQGLIKPSAATFAVCASRATALSTESSAKLPCVSLGSKLSSSCTWRGESYKTQAKAHRNACPVLWSCGHLLHRHSC